MIGGSDLIRVTSSGLYCEAGDFYVDPWEPVQRAVITHAHGDHARPGSQRYLVAKPAERIMRRRMGTVAELQALEFGEPVNLGGVRVSLHPSGHVLGSAQIRVEHRGEVWVVSGDYKRAADPTCAPFEPLRCHTFITEATFGLPLYRWDPPERTVGEIFQWWERNRALGIGSALFCYVLGKAQRVLAELRRFTDRTVFIHGMVAGITEEYRAAGVQMLPTEGVVETEKRDFAGELVLAPPSARGTKWMKRLGECDTAFASGWMRLRGTRRRRSYDRGFALSDHADWPALLQTVGETGAERVLVTHGHQEPLARLLRERGLRAEVLQTPYEGEAED